MERERTKRRMKATTSSRFTHSSIKGHLADAVNPASDRSIAPRGEQRTPSLVCTAVDFISEIDATLPLHIWFLRSCFRLQSRLPLLLLPQSHRNITLYYFSRVFASKYYILPVRSECKRQCTRKSRKKETTNTRCGVCSGTSDKNNNKRRVV